ncbi:MAG: hypothetical protein ABSC19_10225 [Syntrophorhabdales bacterium]
MSRRLAEAKAGTVAWWYPLNDDWDEAAKILIGQRAMGWLGTPYDYEMLLREEVKDGRTGTKAMICSEFCYEALGFKGKIPTPGELPALDIFKVPVRVLQGVFSRNSGEKSALMYELLVLQGFWRTQGQVGRIFLKTCSVLLEFGSSLSSSGRRGRLTKDKDGADFLLHNISTGKSCSAR